MRYLIRAGFNPANIYKPEKYVFNAFVGGNSGNMLFAYGVMNALTLSNTEFEYTYKQKWTDRDADIYNATYDAFILPLADAFRPDFLPTLEELTKLINKLTIPVYVIGVGFRTSYEPDFSHDYSFDKIVYNFVKSVLNHSSIIGLRGDITGHYLNKIGFKEGMDYTPIGCPSLYTYGNNIHTRIAPKHIEKLALNINHNFSPEIVKKFICNTLVNVKDYSIFQQRHVEFVEMYLGRYSMFGKAGYESFIPFEEMQRLCHEDKIKFYFNLPEWIKELSNYDLFLGSRFHGTVATILSGTPHVFVPIDGRTRELAEYHDITRISPLTIKDNSSLIDYLPNMDFNSCEKKHKENYNHYKDFLCKNGIKNIFENKDSFEYGESPMESKITVQLKPSPVCIEALDPITRAFRLSNVTVRHLMNKVSNRLYK